MKNLKASVASNIFRVFKVPYLHQQFDMSKHLVFLFFLAIMAAPTMVAAQQPTADDPAGDKDEEGAGKDFYKAPEDDGRCVEQIHRQTALLST